MKRAVPRLLAAVVLLVAAAACSDSDDTGEPGSATPTRSDAASPSAPASPGPDVELIEIAITGGRAEPPVERVSVAQGSTVRIVVTGDQPDELHLHGYDLEAQLAPGEPGVMEFVADQSGLFELETHESALVLLQLQVQ